ATLVLSLGIALIVVMSAILNAVVSRAVPYPDSSRIVSLWVSIPKKGLEKDWTSYPILRDWENSSESLQDFALQLRVNTATVVRDQPSRVQVGRVSASLFHLLGAETLIGRFYTPEEERKREAVVVISHAYWQQEFGGRSDVIGRTL